MERSEERHRGLLGRQSRRDGAEAPRSAHLAYACVLPGRNTTRWGTARWSRTGDLLPPTVYLLSHTIL